MYQGGICFLCVVYTYFRVPEPSGRSFAEMDMLFQKGVSARKFATTQVDVFEEDVDADVLDNYQQHTKVHRVEDP
jgi:SP family general alpha glucoside:H+ symporter-like MFS transporter